MKLYENAVCSYLSSKASPEVFLPTLFKAGESPFTFEQLVMRTFSSFFHFEKVEGLSLNLLARMNSTTAETVRHLDRIVITTTRDEFEIAEELHRDKLKLQLIFDKARYWTTVREEEDIPGML